MLETRGLAENHCMVVSDEFDDVDLIGSVDRSGGLSYTDSALRRMTLGALIAQTVRRSVCPAFVPRACSQV